MINLGKQFKIAVADKEYNKLVAYCKKAGATKSSVIQVLLSVYLDELINDVVEFAKDVSEEVEDIPEPENEDEFVKTRGEDDD